MTQPLTSLPRWPMSRAIANRAELDAMQRKAAANVSQRQMELWTEPERSQCDDCDGAGGDDCACSDGCDTCDYSGWRECAGCKGEGET